MAESIIVETLTYEHENAYTYYARGHHEPAAFVAAVESYDEKCIQATDVLLGYMRFIPAAPNQRDWTDTIAIYPAKPGRGAFKATWCDCD